MRARLVSVDGEEAERGVLIFSSLRSPEGPVPLTTVRRRKVDPQASTAGKIPQKISTRATPTTQKQLNRRFYRS